MRPYLVGGACHRVKQQVDNALAEGMLALSPELAAHAGRCPRCGPLLDETELLFKRLRSAPANLSLGPVPGVVDAVLQRVAAEAPAPVRIHPPQQPEAPGGRKRSHLRWVLGQVAAIAAVLCVAVGGLTYLALRVNQAAGGARPAEVVERWVAPLQNWSQAFLKDTK